MAFILERAAEHLRMAQDDGSAFLTAFAAKSELKVAASVIEFVMDGPIDAAMIQEAMNSATMDADKNSFEAMADWLNEFIQIEAEKGASK